MTKLCFFYGNSIVIYMFCVYEKDVDGEWCAVSCTKNKIIVFVREKFKQLMKLMSCRFFSIFDGILWNRICEKSNVFDENMRRVWNLSYFFRWLRCKLQFRLEEIISVIINLIESGYYIKYISMDQLSKWGNNTHLRKGSLSY